MADEPDDLVLSLLREMREEIREFQAETRAGFETVNTRIDALENEVGGMGKVIFAIYNKLSDHEVRIADLEAETGKPAE